MALNKNRCLLESYLGSSDEDEDEDDDEARRRKKTSPCQKIVFLCSNDTPLKKNTFYVFERT
jgi:hypothetical protein